MRVIVIDDDEDLVKSLSEFFRMAEIQVVGKGYNGEDAYQLFKEHKPDVVILDMKMPQYDGAYAIKKIKSEDHDAKIIVITGYTDYEFDSDEVFEIFTKPYDIDKLLNAVKKIEPKHFLVK